ncbi:hypothetical protein [Streptosporangium sp. NPDC000509]|uniref:hypothetical protein n=1 Tax=Streptosporangium sp. NPDC000509 TaxID=3366186 RepID=UPI00368B1CCB
MDGAQELANVMRDRFLYPGERSVRSRPGTRKIRVTIDLEEPDYRMLKDLTDRLSTMSDNFVLSHSAVWREMLRVTAENSVLHAALATRLCPPIPEDSLAADT